MATKKVAILYLFPDFFAVIDFSQYAKITIFLDKFASILIRKNRLNLLSIVKLEASSTDNPLFRYRLRSPILKEANSFFFVVALSFFQETGVLDMEHVTLLV